MSFNRKGEVVLNAMYCLMIQLSRLICSVGLIDLSELGIVRWRRDFT